MAFAATRTAGLRSRDYAREIAALVAASFFVALCARIYLPLPGTPVPLTAQNLGVLCVGLCLGSRRGFAAMVLYLVEGAAGLPVFSPHGPGGMLQILGPTGGYLLAYPFVAGVAGFIFERGRRTFLRALLAAFSAELVLFAGGLSWLYLMTHSLERAVSWGLTWFLSAEVIKTMLAAGAARVWQPRGKEN